MLHSRLLFSATALLIALSATTEAAQPRVAPQPPEITAEDGDSVVETVLSLHGALATHMPSAVAWTVFASPIWGALLIWLFLRWIRRSRAEKAKARPRRVAIPRLPQVAPAAALPLLELTDGEKSFAHGEGFGPLATNLTILGHSEIVMGALRNEIGRRFDEASWSATGEETEALRTELATAWVRRIARDRLEAWLRRHALVTEGELEPHVPDDLELSNVDDLCLVYSSGLGANLDREQQELVREAKRALKLCYRGGDNAFIFELIAERVALPALLDNHEGTATSRYPLAAVLDGESAYRLALSLGVTPNLGPSMDQELTSARAGETALPGEGPVFHLLAATGRPPTAAPYLFAALMGGKIGIKEVTLQLSRAIKGLSNDVRQNLGQVGFAAATVLAKTESPARKRILQNLAALLGDQRLSSAIEAITEQLKAQERGGGKASLWPNAKAQGSPDFILLHLYQKRLEHQRDAIGGTVIRALRIFRELAYAGEARLDQEIAVTRFGYALCCFGSRLFSGETEIASQIDGLRRALPS